MAAPEWDWFQREELIGQISDIRVQNLQVERENVQKRTFTRWVNLHLEKCNPPLEVKDLFVDIQDGKILMALLEVLSGRNLLHEYKSSSHRIFRLNNIAKALKFLEDSNVKLVSIDAAEIADGNPSLVLGLIWNIILFFQIKELTGNLSRNSPSSSLSPGSGGTDSDSSFPPTPTAERSTAIAVKDQRKAIRTLLAWVQRKTRKYGVAVQDFAGSWRSGLAFLAVIKAIDPSLVDMKQALEDSMRENLEKAFSIAQEALHIPRLLEPEDIMVDTPDEQSIVTYVAQFLEHFPELEAEDFMDSDREAPIESTFVRIRETSSEQESALFLLTENEERAYTVNHEASHPPPSKVFVCDKPEDVVERCLGGVSSQEPPDGSSESTHPIIEQVLQGVPRKISTPSEPAPESSILSSRKDTRRANSLPGKKTVHFEADTYRDAACSQDPFYSQDPRFEGSPRGSKEGSKQDGHVSAGEVAGESPKQEAPRVPAAAPAEAPGEVSLVDGKIEHPPPFQPSPSWNGASEQAASPGEEGHPLSPLGGVPVMANSLEIKVKLLTVKAMEREDYFEGIPLKASRFNSDLIEFASTSQAFNEAPSAHEKTPAEKEQVPEDPAENLGKRRDSSGHQQTDGDESPGNPDPHAPPQDAGPEEPGYSLAPQGTPVDKKPEVYEKAKRNPPDLFYYPHYEVPLAAVLEAYAEGPEDLKSQEMDLEEPEGYPPGLGAREDEDEDEEAEPSQSSCSFPGLGEDRPQASIAEDARRASVPTPPARREDDQPREPAENVPVPDQQSQEFANSENLANPLEEKVKEESISSKKKEKRKHVDHVESSVFIAPGTVRSSDDLEEDISDHRVISRTSHSDSSIYIRRHTNRSLESDQVSYVQLRNAADLDDRRNRTLTRKANNSGEAGLQEGRGPQSDSLAQLVQQPDVMYFLLFLWLLVYCLLLFPQLDVNRL
uniref:Calmin n=1 Tax=Sus scrofa TaxID=9823 RepID=A0A5G2R1F0_PIG